MKKKSKIECQLIIFRDMYHLYYSYKGIKLRESLGIPEKDGKSHQAELLKHKEKVNHIISDYYVKNHVKPSVQYVKAEMKKEKPSDSIFVIDLFNDFYKIKKSSLKKTQSLKDYTSCFNSLKDYEIIRNIKLSVENLTVDLLADYEIFLTEKHHVDDTTIKIKSKGELTDNTIRKRFDVLKSFFKYLSSNRNIQLQAEVLKPNMVDRYDTDNEYLTQSEIESIYHFQPSTKNMEIVRDIFVFCCMTSLRYSDTITLTKNHITNNIIEKIPTKSRKKQEKYLTPLNATALEILERYNYNLNRFSNQVFNKILKNFLQETHLFDEVISKTYYVLKQPKNKISERYNFISSHTARRTFITNSVISQTPLNALMAMTSHKRIDTLLKYINKYSNNNYQYVENLSVK